MLKVKPDQFHNQSVRDFALRILSARGPLSLGEEAEVLNALSHTQTQIAGAALLSEGQTLNAPALLLQGWAVRQRVLFNGRRQIFGFVIPGDAIGLCDRPDGVAFCSTVALTDVTLAAMPVLAEALWRRVGALHLWGRDILRLEEQGLYDQVVRLGRQSAHERIAHQLLDFYYRLDHAGLARDYSFTLPFTQEVLSDALGLSTVHTNRTLQQMRRDKLIASRNQQITLLAPDRLAAICDYRPLQSARLEAA